MAKRSSRTAVLALVAACGLLAAACSSSGPGDAAAITTPTDGEAGEVWGAESAADQLVVIRER